MKAVVRLLADLGDDVVLAPERWLAGAQVGEGVPLEALVVEHARRIDPDAIGDALVIDTTHAKDGLLDVAAAHNDARRSAPAKSTKKGAVAGELLVSRLRPYLRQIALVPPAGIVEVPLAVSTEFFVLSPRTEGEELAFLLPFLLGPEAQAHLAASQEGGHHPRVPRSSLLALRVPSALVDAREATSAAVLSALTRVYEANAAYRAALSPPPGA